MSKTTNKQVILVLALLMCQFCGEIYQYNSKQDSWSKAYGVLSNTSIKIYDSPTMVTRLRTLDYYPEIKEVHKIRANNAKNDLAVPVFCLEFETSNSKVTEVGFSTIKRIYNFLFS